MDRKGVRSWVAWLAGLVVITALMKGAREDADQAHVVLVYLLVVLGGSLGGGRGLGFFLAFAAFLLIDYYFQRPYDTLTVGKPLDWVVLLAFLAAATVTTQLLARARMEAAQAGRRATEVASLARLGAETLTAGRVEEVIAAMAEVIRSTLKVEECEIYRWDGERLAG